jgi:protein-disulfide isomerase
MKSMNFLKSPSRNGSGTFPRMKIWIFLAGSRALLPVLLTMPAACLLGCAAVQGRVVVTDTCADPSRPSRAVVSVCRETERAQEPPRRSSWIGLPNGVVPVTAEDPAWGSPEALVTVIEFSDFQCPFCAAVRQTLGELKRIYGPAQLRLVWKNSPLPYHNLARSAADAAMTVFALGGADAFWRFHDLTFANQQELSTENYLRWAVMSGVDGARFQTERSAQLSLAKVDADVALATRLGVQSTPVFRVNGIPLTGAEPKEIFREIINDQLAAARNLMANGIPARQVYGLLSAKNAAVAVAEFEDKTVWSVPVRKSDPARGPADALVTLVVFGDFQCPSCRRADVTLARLEWKYGTKLRVVWKDFPQPFHERALLAAVLARVALSKRGPKGFWQAQRALFEGQEDLSDGALKIIAKSLKLSWTRVQTAYDKGRFKHVFKASEELAKTLKVNGTPCAFVNGHRLAGAVPFERFVEVIDAQLAKASAIVVAPRPR